MADTLSTQDLAELKQLYKDLQNIQIPDMADFIKALGGIDAARKNLMQMRKEFANINSDVSYFAESLTKVLMELKNQNNALGKTKSAYSSLSSLANKLKYDQDGISRLSEKELKKMSEKVKQNRASLELAKQINEERLKDVNKQLYSSTQLDPKRLSALRKEKKALEDNTSEVNQFLKDYRNGYVALEGTINKRIQKEKELQEAIGLTGNALKLLNKIPGLSGALDTEQALEDMREFAEELQAKGEDVNTFSNKLKIAGKGLSTAFGGLKKSLTDPVAVLSFFVSKALEANAESVKLGKSLGYGTDRANAFRENLVGIESASANINVTTANLVEAYGELAAETGLAYEFTADQLTTQIKLTKQVGLTADQAAQVQRFAVLNNKTSEETYKSFLKGITAARNQLKVGIDFKATLAEASKVSGQLAAQLGNNPELISRAVVSAKALGMTLEQVAKAGSTLLDFGSSISSELEAELLTGKQINLERARAAALAGDQIVLAEELAKNMGTAAEFTKLNKLQQDSLAKSIGMSSDELAETLRKREEAIASGKSLAQITEEEAAQALERQNIQDQFVQSILKLQSLIGNLLSGPLGMMLDILVKILNVANLILQPFTLLANFIKESTAASLTFLGVLGAIYAIKNRTFLIDKAQLAIEGIKKIYNTTQIGQLGIIESIKSRGFFKTLAEAAMTAFKSVASMPFIGPVLGAAAAASAVGLGMSLFSKGDDVVSPGYGKRVLSTPEGSIALNNKDTIVAGTDLGGGGGSMPSIDLTPMIAAINEVRAAVDRLYSKDQSINMDGKKVGTTLVQGSYKVA
jgi:hypothetical protein